MPSRKEDLIAKINKDFFEKHEIPYIELGKSELDAKYSQRKPVHGWQFVLPINGENETFCLFIDDRFPSSQVHAVMLSIGERYISFPHSEKGGYLCLKPENTYIKDPVQKVENACAQMVKLIEANLKGENYADFMNGFLSYWSRQVTNNIKFTSIIDISNEGKRAFLYKCWDDEKKMNLFASNDDAAKKFFKRVNNTSKFNFQRSDVFVVDVTGNFYPKDYPNSGHSLLALLSEQVTPEELFRLSNAICLSESLDKYVLLKVQTPNGVALIGGILRDNSPKVYNNSDRKVTHGFRFGKASPVVLSRFKLDKIEVNRADFSWVYGRDKNPLSDTLRGKKVCVIGVGSVGSYVANNLAQAGVGNMLLIDKESLDYENISRHCLGANSVGINKAEAMKDYLSAQYPHIEVEFENQDFRRCLKRVKDYDLVLSLIGDFPLQMAINNAYNEADNFPNTLYGFLEERACVGHAILTIKGKGCFGCFFDGVDSPADFGLRDYVTDVGGKTCLERLPVCGGSFMPYGVNEMLCSCSIITDLALGYLLGDIIDTTHKVYVATEEIFKNAGAKLNKGTVEYSGVYNIPSKIGCVECGIK